MKSTYKLFGTVWDGMPDKEPLMSNFDSSANCLMVSLRSLLCASSDADVIAILNPYINEKDVAVDIDYKYEGKNPVVRAFVDKRTRQILSYLSREFGNVPLHRSIDKRSR